RALRSAPPTMSIEPLYAAVPEPLRGYVELVFDRWHQPSARILEALLYRSEYFDRKRQAIALQRADFDHREFVFSTPRLPSSTPGGVKLDIAYDSKRLDLLFRARTEGVSLALLKDTLRQSADDPLAFDELFVTSPPVPRPREAVTSGLNVRYFGHACALVEGREFSVLIDPLIPCDGSGPARFSYVDLPERIDFVLLTHSHQDHVALETLLQLRHKIGEVIVPRSASGTMLDPSLRLLLNAAGFARVREVEDMDSIALPGGGEILALPFFGEHGDLDIRTKSSYAVRAAGKTVAFLADSNGLEPLVYERLAKELGELDLLLIGLECTGAPVSWLYGPLLGAPLRRRSDQSRRLNSSDCQRAMLVTNALRPKRSYVYAMGGEPWCRFMTSVHYTDESAPIVESNKYISACAEKGIECERLYGAADIRV
ncbi:MAG TPA: MBL fold metallo-hydrolase, partial [Polyangiaceae bacterium]|nr:MBL fold metallo-hydrolase [Polyangiaceae bacterium]